MHSPVNEGYEDENLMRGDSALARTTTFITSTAFSSGLEEVVTGDEEANNHSSMTQHSDSIPAIPKRQRGERGGKHTINKRHREAEAPHHDRVVPTMGYAADGVGLTKYTGEDRQKILRSLEAFGIPTGKPGSLPGSRTRGPRIGYYYELIFWAFIHVRLTLDEWQTLAPRLKTNDERMRVIAASRICWRYKFEPWHILYHIVDDPYDVVTESYQLVWRNALIRHAKEHISDASPMHDY